MASHPIDQNKPAATAPAGIVGRDHLSVSTAKTSIVVEFDVLELGALDLWIADQPDPKPSREEASGFLITWALARKGGK
jgi:hypothetical protein